MASAESSPALSDEVDLIDLETGLAPQPRIVISDATPEEQEHLLDVCPPKLEQKLSLTRRSHDPLRNSEERDNVTLVTLGHDQVVPVRKRIDVVSTDTIKRVRDITKNLEPVMRSVDSVDFGEREDDASRQINDAFDFLAELDDNEEEQHRILDEPTIKSYPLEPTCFIQEKSSSFVFDNAAFEASPPGKVCEKRPSSMNFDFDGLKAARNSFKRLRSLTCSAVGLDSETQPWKKKSKNCPYRKSWSAGSRRSRCDLVGKRKRRNSERMMNKGAKRDRLRKSASSVGQSSSSSLSSSSSSSSTSSASSSCSEVDWSWVEEAAAAAAASTTIPTASTSATTTAAVAAPTEEIAAARTPTTRRVRTTTTSTIARENDVEEEEAAVVAVEEEEVKLSVAMSVAAAGKSSPASEPIVVVDSRLVRAAADDRGGNIVGGGAVENVRNANVESNSGTLPWLRASMRRLRQLRILENSNNSSPNTTDPCNSLPDIALIAPEILAAQTNDTTGGLLRPSSAPAPIRSAPAPPNSPTNNNNSNAVTSTTNTTTTTTTNTPRRGRRSRCQQRQTPVRSPSSAESTSTYASSNGGASSTVSSSTTSSATVSPVHQANGTSSPRRLCDQRQRDAERDDERGEDEDEDENPLGKWPHALSPALACLGCTLGFFNISRFAILSIQFGANFIVQFLILSLVIGIPLLTLQVCLGQRLSAGAVDMWKISPLFQGVGIALLTAHAFIGIYSIVGVSWIFVYFRDSFITKLDRYRWAEPFTLYRDDLRPTISSTSYSINYGSVYGGNSNGNNNNNGTYKLHETVPDYFSGAVLQRHHLNEPDPGVVTLKFQVAFNLAVVWMIVFVSLSKGLRSYGKVVYVFTLVPIFGTLVLCTKLLGLTPTGSINQLFPATVWSEFFINGRSWVAAASEVFLTWGLLGAATMQIAAHNKHKHLLQRDTSLVIVLTLVVLLLSAFLANTCVQILKYHGYIYTTSSFERMTVYGFMRPYNQPAPSGYASTPERFMAHASFLVGQRVTRPGAELNFESGYQALRLATELVPATLAVLGTEQVSPFWAVLFYFILILFGIAQQLAIWHCVITGIMAINTKMMKLWETTITFFSCACAYILGLPMATELGIYVVYYLDYTVGGAWWIIVLYLVQVGAVFAVRGRPHTGEAVVAELFPPTGRCLKYWAAPLLSFTWNVVLPITLMVLSISIFKNAGYRELYTYRRSNKDYWAVWARQLGASIQLVPILMIPVVAIIQTCRYLNSGPPDIFDRIQLLYRPSLDLDDSQNGQTHLNGANGTSGHHTGANGLVSSTTELPFEDPPPKYTPPPSYTTATGARIAKMLRQSFRRSVRRIANVLGEGGSSVGTRSRPPLQQQPPPPDYATVLVEMNQSVSSRDVAIHIAEIRPDVANTRRPRADRYARPNTIDRSICRGISTIDTRQPPHRGHYTVDRNAGRRPQTTNAGTSNLTAAEVANLLRSSIRRVPQRQRTDATQQQQPQQQQQQIAASVENLVEAAAPIGHETAPKQQQQQQPLVEQIDKTKDEMDSSVSVI